MLKKLNKKLTKLEREYEAVNENAVIKRERIMKKHRSVEKKIRKLTGRTDTGV